MSLMEKLGVKNIDPKTYCFKPGDHVSVLNTKIPENKWPQIQKFLKLFGLDEHHAFFFHHGIFCENKENKSFFISQTNKGIEKQDAQTFSSGRMNKWHLIKHDYKKYSREHVVKEAESYLSGEKDFGEYSLFKNNCEHFVYKLIEGEEKCNQLRIAGGAVAAFALSAISMLVIGWKSKNSPNNNIKPTRNNNR